MAKVDFDAKLRDTQKGCRVKRSYLSLILVVLLATVASAQTASVVFCVLDDNLDFKTAKAGDTVSLHASRDLVSSGTVLLPRGTPISASVVSVESGKSISLVLEKASLKSGKTVPLMGIIVAVAAPQQQDLGNDPFYQMNHSSEASQHVQPGQGGMDPDASLGSSGAAARTAILEGENKEKTNLKSDSQGAIGIEGLELKWLLDKPPATTVFTAKKKNLKLRKGTEMLLRMAPPEV